MTGPGIPLRFSSDPRDESMALWIEISHQIIPVKKNFKKETVMKNVQSKLTTMEIYAKLNSFWTTRQIGLTYKIEILTNRFLLASQ